MSKKRQSNYDNFQNLLPGSITGRSSVYAEREDKTGASTSSSLSSLAALGLSSSMASGGLNILRNSSRRFYDPEVTTTAIYLPRSIKQKNRWRRWFYDHDEVVGAVLDLHAELPYSKAEIMCDDNMIKQALEDCIDATQFFSMLPLIDLEYLKIGEVFINTPWDNEKGMWKHIIIHNPDFVELSASPFADQEYSIELLPDDELKHLVNSTKPQDQELKRRLPQEIIRRVLSGKNIILDSEEVTHIARRSNPYDLRGTSIIDRLFRLLMYEDKLRESQITIADNFIYPLKIFKLGDPQKGWIPNESHQTALAQMLQQATFDPNFALIYHYALNVDYVTVADKVMKLDREWDEINRKKMIALGVSQQFMTGETTYASANVGLQTQLARYRAKRDLFEVRWIQNKFFKVMAERNEWYRRDKREITGQFRVKREGKELQERLILPKLVWHKKLMMRDDQAFLTFMNNVYAQGKGPLSALTLMQSMGLDLEDELVRKKHQQQLEERIGVYIQPPAPSVGMPGMAQALSKLPFWKTKKGKDQQTQLVDNELVEERKTILPRDNSKATYLHVDEVFKREAESELATSSFVDNIDNEVWSRNLKSEQIPGPVTMLLHKLASLSTKEASFDNLQEVLVKLYMQGKLYAYGRTGFIPYSQQKDFKGYSDLVVCNDIENWIHQAISTGSEKFASHIKGIGISAFCFGQFKGYNEQGIYNVKIENVYGKDGEVFPTEELLNKGRNVSFLLSPGLEICLASPATEGADEDFGNQLDSQVQRYRDFYVEDIKVIDCPIDLIEATKRLFSKICSMPRKNKFNQIVFVKDIIDMKEWEESQKAKIAEELTNIPNDENGQNLRNLMISSRLQQEKMKHRGYIPFSIIGSSLYVSRWVAQENESLASLFIRHCDFLTDDAEKQIRKAFRQPSYDLNREELETYRLLGMLDIVYGNNNQVEGFTLAEDTIKRGQVDSKLIHGRVWDPSGHCLNKDFQDELQRFKEGFRKWIDYPQTLNEDLLKAYENLV